jgi:hypothetical protein
MVKLTWNDSNMTRENVIWEDIVSIKMHFFRKQVYLILPTIVYCFFLIDQHKNKVSKCPNFNLSSADPRIIYESNKTKM